MAKPSTIEVSSAELEAIFQALDMWSKINDGHLTTAPIPGKTRPSWNYSGAVSEILRHENTAGYHVATTHRITSADGSIPHWDARDLHIGDTVIWVE